MLKTFILITFLLFFNAAFAQYYPLINEDFMNRSGFNDLSELLIWGSNTDYKSAFKIADKTDNNGLTYRAIQLTDSAMEHADYHGPENSTKGMTCLDWVFGPVIRNNHDTLKIEFDIYWDQLSSPGERGRINAILLHDYPQNGPNKGDATRFNVYHPFGRPAYHFRLRNRYVIGKTGFIAYGGGNMEKGRLYRHDENAASTPDSLHWLPGAVPVSSTTKYYPSYPEEVNQKEFGSVVASEDHWTHITWYVYPEKQTFYYKNSNESGIGSYFASMDLPMNAPSGYPWFYHWFDTIEAFRIYFYGNEVNTYLANLKISATGDLTNQHRPSISPISSTPLKIYPNPFKDFICIQSSSSTINRIRLFNTEGIKVKDKFCHKKECTFSTKRLSSGLFLLIIDRSNGSVAKKIIKK